MGDVRHIAVTGARGFLGREILRQALADGLRVTAIVRREPETDLGCDTLVQDLARIEARDLAEKLDGVDAIIHAAGEMTSDLAQHARSTLPATRRAAKASAQIGAHFVLISSISVYDTMAVPEGGTVDEATPVEEHAERRDGYAAAKLDQEELVARHCPTASVLRVGALFGPGRIWNAHLGIGLGPVLLRLASRGQVPLCHVTTCAAIALQAAKTRAVGAVNVLEHDLPTRIRFVEGVATSGWPKLVVPMPWHLFLGLGRVLGFWRSRPGLLHPAVLHARMKPLAYDTALLDQRFDVPHLRFEDLMREAIQDG